MINTIVSSSFAQQIAMFLEQNGCINPDTKEMNIARLHKKLIEKEIDIELFNQTLRSIAELDVPDSKPISDFGFLEELLNTIPA